MKSLARNLAKFLITGSIIIIGTVFGLIGMSNDRTDVALAAYTVTYDKELDENSASMRHYRATGSNAFYTVPGLFSSTDLVAAGSTLVAYNSNSFAGMLYMYRVSKISNNNYYGMVTTFDGQYRGWVYVGKNDPVSDFSKVAGGMKYVATTVTLDNNYLTSQEINDLTITEKEQASLYKLKNYNDLYHNAQATDSMIYQGQDADKTPFFNELNGKLDVDSTGNVSAEFPELPKKVVFSSEFPNYDLKAQNTMTGTGEDGLYGAPLMTSFYHQGATIQDKQDTFTAKDDTFKIDKKAIRSIEGDVWWHVKSTEHPTISGWIKPGGLTEVSSYTVNFKDTADAILGTTTLVGSQGDRFDVSKNVPDGYELATGQSSMVTLTATPEEPITVMVSKSGTVDPNPKPDTKPDAQPEQQPETKPEDDTTEQFFPVIGDNNIAKKGQAVYATNNIYLYRGTTFKKTERKIFYARKGRINRPMFVVTGYAYSKNHNLRYRVRDVNHSSKTNHKTGYITANVKYVVPVYYKNATSKIVTVIHPTGVNAYKNKNLTGKQKHYKQGAQIKVVGMVRHNLTTRFKLSNGQYITANKKLILVGKHAKVNRIKTRTPVNRYRTVNLKDRNKHYQKGTVVKITGYDYSNATNVSRRGALRYRVTGGYITANNKFVEKIY